MLTGIVGRSILLAAALLAPLPSALADDYPHKAIRLIVPIAPGGIADSFARLIGVKLQERMGQAVVVENRAGAGGNIGSELVARSPADGYTLVMGYVGSHAANPALYKSMPYDPVSDFTAIIRVINAEGIIAAHPSLPASTLPELLALLRAQPGKYAYSSGGVGTASHMAGELFKSMAKVDIVHVPYKGVAPAVSDLVSGQVALSFASIPTTLGHVKAGRLKVIAGLESERSATMPDVPTVAEAGLPGYSSDNWIGLFAPARTPAEIVKKLNAEVSMVMESQEMQERLAANGARFVRNSPQQFAEFQKQAVRKWAEVVRAAGIVAD
jgi:tripartite-type tricarboxylate transporter receptor subunit TctC